MINHVNDILTGNTAVSSLHYLTTVIADLSDSSDSSNDSAIILVKSFAESEINSDIKNNLIKNNKINSWLALCKKIVNPLLTCQFDCRPDYYKLKILPFCCKIKNFSGQTYGVNIYNDNNKRIMTIIYVDNTRKNNDAVLYTTDENKPLVVGSWSADIKPTLKRINATGLEFVDTPATSVKQEKAKTSASATILSTYYRGNTMTVNDLVHYINKIKTIYDKNHSI